MNVAGSDRVTAIARVAGQKKKKSKAPADPNQGSLLEMLDEGEEKSGPMQGEDASNFIEDEAEELLGEDFDDEDAE